MLKVLRQLQITKVKVTQGKLAITEELSAVILNSKCLLKAKFERSNALLIFLQFDLAERQQP